MHMHSIRCGLLPRRVRPEADAFGERPDGVAHWMTPSGEFHGATLTRCDLELRCTGSAVRRLLRNGRSDFGKALRARKRSNINQAAKNRICTNKKSNNKLEKPTYQNQKRDNAKHEPCVPQQSRFACGRRKQFGTQYGNKYTLNITRPSTRPNSKSSTCNTFAQI